MDNPPETTLVSLIVDGSSARVELAREDKYNAMNVMMITELIEIFEWTAERSAGRQDALLDSNGNQYLRTLVLSGKGRHFCAGADINMMRDAGANTPEENRKDSERLDRLFNGLWSHPCFTIGAIQGVALGGGAGLIACLDYVIGTQDVKIALSLKRSWEFSQQLSALTFTEESAPLTSVVWPCKRVESRQKKHFESDLLNELSMIKMRLQKPLPQ